MCGIFLSLDSDGYHPPSERIGAFLKNRGPDSYHALQFVVDCSATVRGQYGGTANTKSYLTSVSSVLSLRGRNITKQPLKAQDGDVTEPASFLCWNGEAWTFAGSSIRGNDSEKVFSLLEHVSQVARTMDIEAPQEFIADTMATFSGPFAFAYFDHRHNRLYFGRDFLGRRSLLIKRTSSGVLLSSVSDDTEGWEEVEASGLWWIDVKSFLIRKIDYTSAHSTVQGRRCVSTVALRLRAKSMETAAMADQEIGLMRSADILHRSLYDSLRNRLCSIPAAGKHETQLYSGPMKPARVAILFSGGIDCTILARIADDVLDDEDPIDLINVAFENPRVHRQAKALGQSPYEQCPDRLTAVSSLAELRRSNTDREWRLIKVDVPYAEFLKHRPLVVKLIYPHNTEMDLSIAMALYFASRGIGKLENNYMYETTARVLLSGLGADELFAGYTRHATAYSRSGLKGLEDELALDVSRLGKRNLGRDDRVISHWAKEARYPFLDENLVSWALSASLHEKCGFGAAQRLTDDQGVPLDPAKMIIRALAIKLGMPGVAQEKKRAVRCYDRPSFQILSILTALRIQFGARTAKMEVRKTKGTQALEAAVSC